MLRKTLCAVITAVALILLVSCASEPALENGQNLPIGEHDEEYLRERLLEMGLSDEILDSIVSDGISLENMYNQFRFGALTERIHNNLPIGESGEVINANYFGGIYFNDIGILTVTATEAAFNHAASMTAIEEMRELGIIVRAVEFTEQQLIGVMDTMNEMFDRARELGASSWGLDTSENRVNVWLDPYDDERKALFTVFLLANAINPSMVAINQAITPEMREYREDFITRATTFPSRDIVLVGEVEVSRTGIAFSLENRSGLEFNYGARWSLAEYVSGRWIPVEHLPGSGIFWHLIGFSLQAGGIQQYRQEFDGLYDVLPPGRYMFIRDGWLGVWDRNQETVYAVVEFVITEDSPLRLPGQEPEQWLEPISVVEISNITPTGLWMVIDNLSDYDIDHRAQIIAIVREEDAVSDNRWEWESLPFLPVEGYWMDYLMQGEGFLPSGGRMAFHLDWEAVFGEIPPGEYRLDISLGGHAHPPHPTGWISGGPLVIQFEVLPE